MARGEALRLSNPPTTLPDGSWTEQLGGGGSLGAYGMSGFQWWWWGGGLQGCTGYRSMSLINIRKNTCLQCWLIIVILSSLNT